MIPLAHDGLLTAADAARLTGRSVKTIYQWASRGVRLLDGTHYVLPVAGLDNRGNKLFRLDDVQTVAHATARRGTSRAPTIAA